jgi:tyrosyl-tRNA synthetase
LGLKKVVIERPTKFGGDISFASYEELEKTFAQKQVHPLDLKTTLAKLLDQLLIPVRQHFDEDPQAKALLEKVKTFQITR